MPEILVFAGTTEGRKIAEFLWENGVKAKAFVATEYGEILLPAREKQSVRTGRMDQSGMEEIFAPGDLVIDATHPYAAEVTRNLKKACERRQAEYLRLLRPSVTGAKTVTVESAAQAAAYLDSTQGAVLLTTGSKELAAFAFMKDGAKRLYARVLPTVDALEKCEAIGLRGPHVLAMQGPFSLEMNTATLRQIKARYLVTKDSGAPGGFPEKIAAAVKTGATVVLISRPGTESGLSVSEAKELLTSRYSLKPQEKNHFFPLFVDLAGQPVLVAGGGTIAARRVQVLLSYGADVTVVSPSLNEELQALRDSGRIRALMRKYRHGDCANAFLAVAATSDRVANESLSAEGKLKRIPVSVADRRGEGSFFFPAVFEGGGISGGLISLEGRNHALAKEQAEKLRKLLCPAIS